MRYSPLSHTTSLLIVIFVGMCSFAAIEQNILSNDTATQPTGQIAGATELNAIVPPNPTNTLYVELQQKQTDLKKKEQELNARESFLNSQLQPTPKAIHTLYTLIVGLFILIVINFILDLRRKTQHA